MSSDIPILLLNQTTYLRSNPPLCCKRLVSKETTVQCQISGRVKHVKFGFIKRVCDHKGQITTVKDLESWCFEKHYPFVRANRGITIVGCRWFLWVLVPETNNKLLLMMLQPFDSLINQQLIPTIIYVTRWQTYLV